MMTQATQYQGIMAVLATPFDTNNKVDYAILDQHIDYLLSKGICSFIEGGSTGEFYALSFEERKDLLAFVAQKLATRAQLIAGTNSSQHEETLMLNELAETLGFQTVLIGSPPYAIPNTEGLIEHFSRIAKHSPKLDIILYNFPARTSIDMCPTFLSAMRSYDNVVAIKESSGLFSRMLEQVLQFPRLQRICGADDQALDYFLWGAQAWITGAANFLPEEHNALYRACVVKRDFEAGHAIMSALLPMFSLLEQGGKYIQYVKYGTSLAGINQGLPRMPLAPLHEAEKDQFRKLYAQIKSSQIAAMCP